jgi:toxin-antitoxin system PIN domain toxin
MPWAVLFGFVRLVTHPRVLQMPLSAGEALDRVDAWLACPGVLILDPGPRHLKICRDLFEALGVAASLTTDVHLAALAIENQAELHSNDGDFRRFPGLRWVDPTST